MSRGRRAALALAACGLLALASARPCAAARETVAIGAEDDWFPYSAAVGGEARGLSVDLVRAAFAASGIQVRFVPLPFKRCIAHAREGQVAGCFNLSKSPRVIEDFLWPREPLTSPRILVYARSDWNGGPVTPAQLAGRELLVSQEYLYGGLLERHPRIRRVVARTDLTGLRMLMSGRADFMLLYERAGDHLIQRDAGQLAGRVRVVGELGIAPQYVGFSRNRPDSQRLVAAFDGGMRRILANGTAARVERAWRQQAGGPRDVAPASLASQ
jgi:polar amino acid transport system substrate-binding protein